MSRNSWLIGVLVVVVVVLVGALMFLIGRVTSSPSKPPSPASDPIVEQVTAIPEPFRGEWNADLGDCGTGNNDTRLRVEANVVRFYESDGEVRSVTPHNSRAITVELALSGEGQSWNDSTRMVLSRSGAELTIDGFTRHRCS